MRVLLITDSFPPGCGGSGWSTYELARGLRARGHEVDILQPRPGQSADGRREYDGFVVEEIASAAPAVPYVRNYFKNERLWPKLAARVAARPAHRRPDLLHAQHVLTTPAAIRAGAALDLPVVATVRDYWPVCYWADLIHDPDADHLCPACTPGNMTVCVRPRAGAAWPLALPMIPYMRGNLRRKRAALARADAVIAVSSVIEHDLRQRAPELAATRIEQIPNPVDVAAIVNGSTEAPPLAGPYALYSGKLAPNKGANLLIGAARAAQLRWPLVVVGDGPLRPAMENEARGSGLDVRFTGWLERAEALRWMRHASLLIFPSRGPESLSRVLLEASALAVPIAAMDTGGTRDIVEPGVTGLLSTSAEALASDAGRLIGDRTLAARLGAAARARVLERFDAPRVVARIASLYEEVTCARGRSRG